MTNPAPNHPHARHESASTPAFRNHRHPFLQDRRTPHEHGGGPASPNGSALDVTAAERREQHERHANDVEAASSGAGATAVAPSPSRAGVPAVAMPSTDGGAEEESSRSDDDEVREEERKEKKKKTVFPSLSTSTTDVVVVFRLTFDPRPPTLFSPHPLLFPARNTNNNSTSTTPTAPPGSAPPSWEPTTASSRRRR